MQETIKTYSVQIGGADSVKALKQEISDLRDKLVSLDSTTDEYKDVVSLLVKDEMKLKEVMSATKEVTDNAKGSYNALVNEMGALKKVWKSVTDEATRNEIGSRIAEINSQLKDMDASIGNHQRNVGNYEEAITKAFMTPQQELKKLKMELAGMEEGSDVYNKTFQRMAELTHNVTEQQEMLKWSSADLGDILGNLAGVAQGVAGGFSAINAIQGLIGNGNEDVEKAMQTTQNWIQLIQGLGAIEELGDKINGLIEGCKNYAKAQQKAAIETEKANMTLASNVVQTNRATTATVGFTGGLKKAVVSVKTLALSIKTALISSGIGLLVVALGAVVGWLWKYVDGTEKAERASNSMGEANDKLEKSLEKSNEAWSRQERLMKAQGATYEEIYQAKKKHLTQQLTEAKQTLKHNEAIVKRIGLKNLEKEKYKEVREEYNRSRKAVEDLNKELSNTDFDKRIEQIEKEAEARKKATEAYKNQLDEAKKLAKELIDSTKTETEKIEESYQQRKAIIDKYIKDEDTKEKANAELKKQFQKDLDEWLIKETENAWKKKRAVVQKEMEYYNSDTKEFYDKQIEESLRYFNSINNTLTNIANGNNSEKELKMFNAIEGTNIQSVEELVIELGLVEKQLDLIGSNEAFDKLMLDVSNLGQFVKTNLGNSLSEALEKFNLNRTNTEISDSRKFLGIKFEPKDLTNEDKKTELEARYNLQEEYINAELELYQNALDSKVLIGEQEAEVMNRIYELITQKELLSVQKSIEANELRVENFRNTIDSMNGIADSLGSVFSSISNIIMDSAQAQLDAGEISQEEYEKEFERAKKFQIAEAIINTISGAVGAFTGIMKSTGGWGIALAVAQMAAVLATGYAQIEQIKNTKPNSSSSSSSSGTKYAMATPSATADYSPQLTQNATGSQETESLANALSSNPIKAYVVESDISAAQQTARQRNNESSF